MAMRKLKAMRLFIPKPPFLPRMINQFRRRHFFVTPESQPYALEHHQLLPGPAPGQCARSGCPDWCRLGPGVPDKRLG